MNGILGTSATTTSDLTLLAYVFILLPGMIVGFLFARRKMFVPYHKLTMTAVTLVNWGLIAYVMLVSYSYNVAPELPGILSQLYALVATIHLVTGALAQAFATYLIILMWTERTRFEGLMPAFIRIRRIKTPMRVTLALWITTVVLGLGIYFTWYAAPREDVSSLAQPGATEDPATTPEANADVAVTENATPPAVTEDATGEVAITEDSSANVASTENATPPAVTEDATGEVAITEDSSANVASTEDATPRPTRTKKAPATTEEASVNAPATTEEACLQITPAATEDASIVSTAQPTPTPRRVGGATVTPTPTATPCLPQPAVTEDASPCPAMTEAVDDDRSGDDDDDMRPCPAATESADDDNTGRGSSNSGSGSSNSGSSSGSGSSNSGSGSSNSGSGSSNSGSGSSGSNSGSGSGNSGSGSSNSGSGKDD